MTKNGLVGGDHIYSDSSDFASPLTFVDLLIGVLTPSVDEDISIFGSRAAFALKKKWVENKTGEDGAASVKKAPSS